VISESAEYIALHIAAARRCRTAGNGHSMDNKANTGCLPRSDVVKGRWAADLFAGKN